MATTDGTLIYNAQRLTASFDDDLGLVMLRGVATGAAGAVEVDPAPGVLCSLDAVSGTVFEIAFVQDPKGGVDAEVADLLTFLFGGNAASKLPALSRHGGEIDVAIGSEVRSTLHLLGLLEVAQSTDPVQPGSALWGAEAALVAHEGGLGVLARRIAAEVADPFAELLDEARWLRAEERIRQAALVVAALAEPAAPDASEVLRELVSPALFAEWEAAMGPGAPSDRLLVRMAETELAEPGLSISAMLDGELVPPGLFVFGEDPGSDLAVRRDADGLFVTVRLDRRAPRGAAERCVARIVEAASHRVLASGRLSRADDDQTIAGARIEVGALPTDSRDLYLEIVDDEERPVAGPNLRHLRRAIRYGTSALRIERRARLLHPGWDEEDWSHKAALYWQATATEWAASGDAPRAAIARALAGDHPVLVEWAAPLAHLGEATHHRFLAELFSHPTRSYG